MKTKSNTSFPQLVEIPQPLEVHPSVSPLAAELLLKTAEVLARTPELYNQMIPNNYCGSAFCIIGHMQVFNDNNKDVGLTPNQEERIFHASDWPLRFVAPAIARNEINHEGISRQITAAEGIARIEFFLRTGE